MEKYNFSHEFKNGAKIVVQEGHVVPGAEVRLSLSLDRLMQLPHFFEAIDDFRAFSGPEGD